MRALDGTRVIEVAAGVAAEYCGKLLADFGAEVIKLEQPGTGSGTRRLGPFSPGVTAPENSGLFAYLNTNKRSVAIDLHDPVGRETAIRLLDRADVLLVDGDAESLANMGLAPRALEAAHPGLVICSITAFGLDAPPDRRHATDLTIFHSSGWGYHTPSQPDEASPPLKGAGRFLSSYEGGLEGAMCVAAALYERADSGLGRLIDIAMQEVLASRVDYVLGQMVAGDMPVSEERTAFDLGGPAGIFPCRDGYAYIWMSAPAHWDALGELLDDTAWMSEFPPDWLERGCTPERVAECRRHIAAWLENQDKHEAAAAAQALGLTLVAVNNATDLLASEQYLYRGYFQELTHPELGTQRYPTVPYRMSETPAVLERPAPTLGQHTGDYVGEQESGTGRTGDD